MSGSNFLSPDLPAYLLSVGAKSPWYADTVPVDGGAALVMDMASAILVCHYPSPTRQEIRVFERGKITPAIASEGYTGFFMVRIQAPIGRPAYLEAPFHVGLERIGQATCFDPVLEEGVAPMLTLLLVDETGTIRAMRVASIPAHVFLAASAITARQRTDAALPDFETRHRASVQSFQRRYRTTQEAFSAAARLH